MPRVTLSPDIPSDARFWRNDESIWRWCRQHTPISASQHERWLRRIGNDPTIKMFGVLVVGEAFGDIQAGVCGLTSIDRINQSAEFSLYIAPEFQSQGYGKQALRALLEHGFRDQNLNRIWGEVFYGNPALRMFTDVGMKVEGVRRQAYFRSGRFIDATMVAMLREEYRGT